MDQNTKDILGTVNFIKDRMLSKDAARTIIRDEFPGMIREELKPIHHELKEINKSIDVSTRSTKNTRISRESRRRGQQFYVENKKGARGVKTIDFLRASAVPYVVHFDGHA